MFTIFIKASVEVIEFITMRAKLTSLNQSTLMEEKHHFVPTRPVFH